MKSICQVQTRGTSDIFMQCKILDCNNFGDDCDDIGNDCDGMYDDYIMVVFVSCIYYVFVYFLYE